MPVQTPLANSMSKRALDVLLILLAVPVIGFISVFVALVILVSSGGPVLYWSQRVGRDNQLFEMPKFRTMRTDTPPVATHLLVNPRNCLTPVGHFLRRTSLDELPQCWSILTGQMSIVGPRPALFNQDDLVEIRTAAGVHRLKPGLTGWAQVRGRDELSIADKVKLDIEYMRRMSIWFDLRIIFLTIAKVLGGHGVSH